MVHASFGQPSLCLPAISLLSAYPGDFTSGKAVRGNSNMKDKGHWIFYHANLAMGDMSAALVQFSVPGSSSSPEPRRALLTSTTPGLNFSEETGSSVVLRDSWCHNYYSLPPCPPSTHMSQPTTATSVTPGITTTLHPSNPQLSINYSAHLSPSPGVTTTLPLCLSRITPLCPPFVNPQPVSGARKAVCATPHAVCTLPLVYSGNTMRAPLVTKGPIGPLRETHYGFCLLYTFPMPVYLYPPISFMLSVRQPLCVPDRGNTDALVPLVTPRPWSVPASDP
eukprot:gene6993-63_t